MCLLDACIQKSGSINTKNHLFFIIGRYVPIPTSAGGDYPQQHRTTSDWAILLYPDTTRSYPELDPFVPPTLLPLPQPPEKESNARSNSYVEAFDEKWNIALSPEETAPEEEEPQVSRSMPGTMVLVIGIILGSFVAMILIVIIGMYQ